MAESQIKSAENTKQSGPETGIK